MEFVLRLSVMLLGISMSVYSVCYILHQMKIISFTGKFRDILYFLFSFFFMIFMVLNAIQHFKNIL